MPIYAYRCSDCGHAQDVLQRMSDPVLTVCPSCGASTYVKQVTAAGFQLKGSGWYVTDFRGGNTAAKPAEAGDADKPAEKTADKAADKPGEKAAAQPAAVAEKAASPAPSAATAASSSSSSSASASSAPAPAAPSAGSSS